jgi:hypothetical protein
MAAQVVTGRIVDATSGMPVGIGFVVLLDDGGNEVSRALSARDGRFTLRAPGHGTYRIRSERIGYRATVSEPLEIPPQATLSYTLRVTAIPIVLSAVEVPGEDRCRVSPDRAAETGVVWEEIRKALAATAWDGTQELARYRTYNFERTLSPNRRSITAERGRVLAGVARQPYISHPAELLAQQGYVVEFRDSTLYYLPDPGVLMHDSFLASHCFRVVRDAAGRPGQVGLAFESLSGPSVSDVRGALWLDEETSQLTTLEVGYTRLPNGLEDERVGGTIEFLMLPSGAWIASRWELRTPMIRLGRPANPFDRGPRQLATIKSFRDFGGEVLEITTREGERIYPARLAHVTGTVYDSSKAMPLSGVRVAIDATGFWTVSDKVGAFHLTAPLEGEYSVVLSHPRLDSIAYRVQRLVELRREETRTLSFAIPSTRSILAQLCPMTIGRSDFAAVVGRVTRRTGTEAVADADVTATWQLIESRNGRLEPRAVEAVVTTDEPGRYMLCGIPVGHPVTIQADRGRARSSTASLILPRAEHGTALLAFNRDPVEGYTRSFTTGHRIWKLDLELNESGAGRQAQVAGHVLAGFVTDRATGQPIGGVTVGLNGTENTVTRDDGTFDIVDVDWLAGSNVVAVGRMGYQPWAQEIWLEGDEARLDLSVSLESRAIALDPVDVTGVVAEQYLSDVGFYRRQQFNPGGYFMDREEIEQRLGRVNHVVELLTGVVGVKVGDSKPGSFGATLYFQRGLGFGAGAETECSYGPRIFVDGFVIENRPIGADNIAVSGVVRPEDVYAIEVYRTPSQIPPQYGGAQSACGVLLIWTRRGR